MKNKRSVFYILFLFTAFFCHSQNSSNPINLNRARLPELKSLKSSDAIFKEYSNIVSENQKAIAAGYQTEMIFFTHKITEDDSSIISGHESQLLAIASRCNISYDTLASINGIEDSTTDLMNKSLILPTVSGLFIKTGKGNTSLEILLHENYANDASTASATFYTIDGEEYAFLEDVRFSPTERAYFLDSSLRLPLDKDAFWISSDFGKRISPISGEWKDHKGIDMAAPEGTPVYAIKNGDAAYCIENDETFGNYIILSHDKGSMTSVYAHLSSICIKKYDSVKKGDIIGYVGHTGMATGSHLHFEIRQGGVPLDPQKKLKI